ncbi:MAG TPA: hypothetical protein P5082_01185, partial [Treponema sp.]|nr:hypothetical protein [Treponema sp.]
VDRSRGEKISFIVNEMLDIQNLTEKSYREIHIRLTSDAAEKEENLYPLRDHLFEHSGPCSVFIHIPVPGGESVVRTATQITSAADQWALESIGMLPGVAEVWRE